MTCQPAPPQLHPWELSAALASTSFNHAHLQHRNTGRRGFRARGRLRAPVSAPRKRPSAAGERQHLSCVSPETWVPANVLSWCLPLPVAAFLDVQPSLINKFGMPGPSRGR